MEELSCFILISSQNISFLYFTEAVLTYPKQVFLKYFKILPFLHNL